MKNLFKKASICLIAVAMLVSACISVGAENEMTNMRFVGYDTTDFPSTPPNKIYNEVIDGQFSNKQLLVPVDRDKIGWKIEGFEQVYPYAGYSRLYLEDNAQKITCYNSLFPQWPSKRLDFMWEIKAPHYIYERQQTKVNNTTWTWDYGNKKFNIPDTDLLTKTVKRAVITDISYKSYGFGKYLASGALLSNAERAMYNRFDVDAATSWDAIVNSQLTVENLSRIDPNTHLYVFTDKMIQDIVPTVYSKYITGKFNTVNDDGLCTKDVAAEYLKHANDDWDWDMDSLKAAHDAKIEWSKPYFEMAEPYNYYQYLIINDVIMDGIDGKDRIFRYTGAKASPEITWDFAFFQNYTDSTGRLHSNVYEVVEFKRVNGEIARDADNNFIYRIPTGKYGNTFFRIVGDTIEYWVIDSAGHTYLLRTFKNFEGNIGGLIDAYYSLPEYMNQLIPSEQTN